MAINTTASLARALRAGTAASQPAFPGVDTPEIALAATVPAGASAPPADPAARGSNQTIRVRLSPSYDGAALVLRPGSDLIVGTAPVSELGILLARPLFKQVSYVITMTHGADLRFGGDVRADATRPEDGDDGKADETAAPDRPGAKIGETLDWPRRCREHLRRPPVRADRVYLVASLQPDGLDKDELLAVEAALTHQARYAGRCEVHGGPANPRWLDGRDPGLMARRLGDVRDLLVGAGCFLLEPCTRWIRPTWVVEEEEAADFDGLADLVGRADLGLTPGRAAPPPAAPARPILPALKTGYRLAPAGLGATPGAVRHVLVRRGARATAIQLPDGSVVIEAGSVFAAVPRSGVQPCILRKHARLRAEGLFREAAGGALELSRAIQVSTLLNAARLATVSNLPGDGAWRRA